MTDVRSQKSTIVRTNKPLIPAPLRGAFTTLEWVAPVVGARWAARLWSTPPRPPRDAYRRGARPRLGHRFTVPLTGGGTAVAEVWGSGPVTYLVHGWGGWRGQLGAFVPPMLAAGRRVVAVDAPGHGEAGPGRLGGRRTTLVEMAEAVAAVVDVTGPVHSIVAHSAGASAAALAVHDGLPVERLVFIAPMADPVAYTRLFAAAAGLGPRTYRWFMHRVADLVRRDFAVFDVPAWAADMAAGITRPPLLVVHDRHDRETAYADGQAIAGGWPGGRLVTTEGLGHRRLLTDPGVVDTVTDFLISGSTVDVPPLEQ